MVTVGVLALQGDFAEHEAILKRLSVETRQVRLPSDLDGIDSLIIPGGESTTITRLMAISGLVEPVRRFAVAKPVWGTCAGMIVMAKHATDLDRETLGLMDISVIRNAFGRQVDSFETDLDFAEIDGPRLWDGLGAIRGVTRFGPPPQRPRTPTVSVEIQGRAPRDVAAALADSGLFLSHGDYYATTVAERYGRAEGFLRIGLSVYSTASEVDRVLHALAAYILRR